MGCGNSKQINKVPPTFDEWNGDAAGSFYSDYAAAKGESKQGADQFWTTDCTGAKLAGGSTDVGCGDCNGDTFLGGGFAVQITCPFGAWGLCQGCQLNEGVQGVP